MCAFSSIRPAVCGFFLVFIALSIGPVEVQGQQDSADTASQIKQLEQDFLAAKEIAGNSDLKTIEARHKWATALTDAGDLTGAFPIAKENFELVLADLDPKEGHELPMKVNLLMSQLFFGQGQPEKAINVRQQLVGWGEQKAGPEHIATLSFKMVLAQTMADAGKTQEAIGLNESVIGNLESKLPADHQMVIINQKFLLDWYQKTEKHTEALRYGTKCLDTLLKTKGGIDGLTLEVAEKVATSCQALNRPEDAVPWIEKTLALCRRINPNNSRLLQFKAAAGQAYHNAGDTGAAIKQLEEVVARHSSTLGESHDATTSTRSMLTMYYKGNGQFKEAITNTQPTLNWTSRKYGPRHPAVLKLRQELASLHEQAGNTDASNQIKKELVEIRRQLETQLAAAKKQFDDDQKSTPGLLFRSVTSLIGEYSNSGKNEEAIELATKWQEQSIVKAGLGSPEALIANSALVRAMYLSGEDRDALSCRVEFVQRLQEDVGAFEMPTLAASLAYADTLWMLGQQKRSVSVSEDCLKRISSAKGPENVSFVAGSIDLANRYYDVGLRSEAAPHFEAIYENLSKISDDNDPILVNTRVRLGFIRILQNKDKEAIEMLQKAYQALVEGPSKDIALSLATANLLALAKQNLGELNEAYSLFSRVSEESAKLRSSNKKVTSIWLEAEQGVAYVLVAQEKFEDAEKKLTELIQSQEEILGRNHAWTRRTKQTLAGVYQSLGKTDLQKRLLEELNSAESKN